MSKDVIVNKEFKINSHHDLPVGTYGEAMHLTETMEGWRSEKPVVNCDTCIECGVCYYLCPEGVMSIEDGKVDIDYRFCKGCGICAKECIAKCISMEREVK